MPPDKPMSLSVRTNVQALRASRNLGNTNARLGQVLGQISSGRRINKAADDAAGLGVSTNLETQRGSLRVAMRNINDGLSALGIMESATSEVIDIVQHMRELAIQSSSETLLWDERRYIQDEQVMLLREMDRIAEVTEFNGTKLADGSGGQLSVQVGILNNDNHRIDISTVDLSTGAIAIIWLSTSGSARWAIDMFDSKLDELNGMRSDMGASTNRLESALDNAGTLHDSLASSASKIMDTDFAAATAEMTKLQIMQQAGVAALVQSKNLSQSIVNLLS